MKYIKPFCFPFDVFDREDLLEFVNTALSNSNVGVVDLPMCLHTLSHRLELQDTPSEITYVHNDSYPLLGVDECMDIVCFDDAMNYGGEPTMFFENPTLEILKQALNTFQEEN